jgi:uncharacterized protein with NRDE domain
MCLILFAIDSHPQFPLAIAANRDEFHRRPTRWLSPWPQAPQLLAGQDLSAGGTWLGLARSGRFAAVTNVHDPDAPAGRRSRGELTRDFLLGTDTAADYAQRVVEAGADYAGFNLLLGAADGFYYCSNRSAGPRRLGPGLYGLSNGELDSDWPKVINGKAALRAQLEGQPDPAALLGLLALGSDREIGDFHREHLLAYPFIRSPEYGTRASTAVLVDAQAQATVWEQNYGSSAEPGELLRYVWQLDAVPR